MCCCGLTLLQFNCCKSADYDKRGCTVGQHSDQVDDSDLRGYSIDPRSPEDVARLQRMLGPRAAQQEALPAKTD